MTDRHPYLSLAIQPYPITTITDSLPQGTDEPLTAALLSSLTHYQMSLRGRRIWLACSGGRDSMVLAACCAQLYRQGQLPFLPQLLHVDHGLQADSRYWAQHVQAWANAQQLPCRILTVAVAGADEQAARQARYQAMRAQMNRGDVLLLGHHADDQAETVLMRLMQGAGVKGLSGMQPWRVHQAGGQEHILWRPWLGVRRASISRYAQYWQLPYIEDPTNRSGDNVRSSMRRDILPALAKHNPQVIENIARSAELLTDAAQTVAAQAATDVQKTAIARLCYPPAQRVLATTDLRRLPRHQQRQCLHAWLGQDEPLPPAKQLIDDVWQLAQRDDNDHQTQLYWHARTHHYVIRRYQQRLYRLSETWLTWLAQPIISQTVTLPLTLANHATKLCLRADATCIWRLSCTRAAIMALLQHHANMPHATDEEWQRPAWLDQLSSYKQLTVQITPLGHARVQTAFAMRPQTGKRLYQTLAIPVWLRASLVVVSIAPTPSDTAMPLLLLSPNDCWLLGFDKSTKRPDNALNGICNQLQFAHSDDP